jgi:iron complex outermembrane recepter protein
MAANKSVFGPTLVRAAVAAVLGTAAYNLAQAADDTTNLDEVQVTGTRIQQRGDYTSPNPITTLGAADLEKLGIVNVSDAMNSIPQNVSQFTPANTGGGAFFIGSTLANLRGLNPFFGTRTLTLVDSRRFIPTTQGDSVDLNFIPTNMISRMEVVTGGASAAYGSGAISGVVNVLLDKKLQGLKLDADYGQTSHGDGKNWHIGIAGGTDFAGGRGHVVAGGEYQTQDAIQSCADARDWCSQGRGLFNNNTGFAFAAGLPYSPKIAGQPNFSVVSGLRENQLSRSGVIFQSNVGGAFAPGGQLDSQGPPNFLPWVPARTPIVPTSNQTWQFNDAGTDIVPFTVGAEGWRSIGGQVIGGSGDRAGTNVSLFPEVKRKTFFSHGEFDFTEKLTGYLELSYGQVEGVNHQWGSGQNSANACIQYDNAFLQTLSAAAQAAIAGSATNNPFATFPNSLCLGFNPNTFGFSGTVITKNWNGQNDQTVTTDTKVTRAVAGMNGKFGETWNWDAYYQYGKTTRDQIGVGYRTNWRYDMAIDSVIDTRVGSATLGQPVCRVTATGILPGPPGVVDPSLAVGCKPLNPFGTRSASAAALAYAFGPLTEHDDIRQDVVAASANGQLWQGWGAGALSAAAGLEYRRDTLLNDAGSLPFAQRTDFGLQYGDSFGGKTEVTEEFVEFEMPLLKDQPGADSLTLNAAVRHANYKTEGGIGTSGGTSSTDITTSKFAAVWDLNEWLRFRGSYSKDLRAAGFRELFYSQSIPAGGFFGSTNNPWQSPAVNNGTDAAVLILSGNPDIRPEEAATTTVGIVLSPLAGRMHFSADYYHIKLDGGLALGNAGNNVGQCFAAVGATGNPITSTNPFCKLLTFGAPITGNSPYSNITSLKAVYENQSAYTTKGIDFAWDYSIPMESGASVTLRLTASHTLETIVPNGRDVAGQTGGDQGFLSDFSSAPKWSGNLTASYTQGPFTGTVQGRYISTGYLDLQNPKTGPDQTGYDVTKTYSVSDNNVPSYFLVNLNGSYDMKWFDLEKMQVYASINNVLDKDPPFSAGTVGGANAIFFDALGRTYRVGVRVKF